MKQHLYADGRSEVREFPARIENGRLRWDNELIDGWPALALSHRYPDCLPGRISVMPQSTSFFSKLQRG